MKSFNLWDFKHFYDMSAVDCFFLSSASSCPHFILIFAINLQQWEKKIVEKGFCNLALIKVFKRMSIVQKLFWKRKCDSDYFYSLFSLRQGHESFQYDFVLKLKKLLSILCLWYNSKTFILNKVKRLQSLLSQK